MKLKKTFRSNGKLLITGEYFVLDGANAFALPTNKGQELHVSPIDDSLSLNWKSFDSENKIWFEGRFSLDFKITVNSDDAITQRLIKMLKTCIELNPSFNPFGVKVETFLEFPTNWGLGSSSTLLNNLAQWAQVNPFELLWKSFTGSGYDIANAANNHPILYSVKNKIPKIKEIHFSPSFKEQLFFIHLNQKQNSREGINHYKALDLDKTSSIKKLNNYTKKLLEASTLIEFEEQLILHENLISKNLKIDTVKSLLFNDYAGAVKSLGAWGGDFVLVTFREGMKAYFNKKGFHTILSFDEMILNS